MANQDCLAAVLDYSRQYQLASRHLAAFVPAVAVNNILAGIRILEIAMPIGEHSTEAGTAGFCQNYLRLCWLVPNRPTSIQRNSQFRRRQVRRCRHQLTDDCHRRLSSRLDSLGLDLRMLALSLPTAVVFPTNIQRNTLGHRSLDSHLPTVRRPAAYLPTPKQLDRKLDLSRRVWL